MTSDDVIFWFLDNEPVDSVAEYERIVLGMEIHDVHINHQELWDHKQSLLKLLRKKYWRRAANKVRTAEFGNVLCVGDGIVEVDCMSNAFSGELVRFESGESGIILNLETAKIKVIVLGSGNTIKPGMVATRCYVLPSVFVSSRFLGRVVDGMSSFIDNVIVRRNLKRLGQHRALEQKAPGIIFRQKVTEPVYTGLMVIDSMIPIGRGQRELIIGDRQTGKTTIALDTITTQNLLRTAEGFGRFSGLFCVYVSIGQRRSSVSLIAKRLFEYGAIDFTTIVAATASDPASMQFLAPYTGCAIGEFYRDSGMHALVVYDDLSKHAVAYRQISLLLRRPPSREAYPGDVFYLHSRLLERAAKLSNALGGGSLTALPIIETQAGDVSAYIPTNVISITDGQIFLESSLFYKGFRPAVNIGISVSRIGAAAQTKCMRRVAGTLKLELAQFREIETFASFGSDIDETTKRLLLRGQRLLELLKQDPFSPLIAHQQVVLVYAGVKGYLDTIDLENIAKLKSSLLFSLAVNAPALMFCDLDMELPEEQIKIFLEAFFKKHHESSVKN